MKKKWKWVFLCAIVLIVTVAPLPYPYFADFTSVYNYEEKEEDVTVRVRFFHFKPLFLRYGNDFEGYGCLGSVKVYDNSGENICTLKLDHNVMKDPNVDDMYFTMCSERSQNGSHDGYLIWDENCQNIIVPIMFQTENFEAFSTTNTNITYFCSKDGLRVGEIKALFYKYDTFFLPSYTETKYHPNPLDAG